MTNRPKFPLQLFDKRDVIEIQDADGKVLVKWTGFEASDFSVEQQRAYGRLFVNQANKAHGY